MRKIVITITVLLLATTTSAGDYAQKDWITSRDGDLIYVTEDNERICSIEEDGRFLNLIVRSNSMSAENIYVAGLIKTETGYKTFLHNHHIFFLTHCDNNRPKGYIFQ